jgi:hypothetical protein
MARRGCILIAERRIPPAAMMKRITGHKCDHQLPE